MHLSQMKENDTAVIKKIEQESDFARRFFDMGFVEGNKVKCLNIGLKGTPIAYLICGSKIALRKKDASRIRVIM